MADRRAVFRFVAHWAGFDKAERHKKDLADLKAETQKTSVAYTGEMAKMSDSNKEFGKSVKDNKAAVRDQGTFVDKAQEAFRKAAQAIERHTRATKDNTDVVVDNSRTLEINRSSVHELGSEHNRLHKATDASGRGFGNFLVRLMNLKDGMGSLGKEARDVGVYMRGLLIPSLIALFGNLAAIIMSLVAGLTSLIGPLSQVVSLLGVLPAGLMAVVAAGGTLFASFKGIGAALQALNKASEESNSTTARSMRERADAAEAVIDAQRGLSDAIWAEKKAEEAVTEARRQARYALQDLRMEADRNAISEQRAQLSLIEAQRRVQEIQQGFTTATDIDYANALLDVQEAQLNVSDAQRKSIRDSRDLREAERKGVDNANQVIDAQHALANAINAVSDAQRALTRANEVAAAGSSSIFSANEKVAEAMKNFSPAGRRFVRLLFSMKDSVIALRKAAQTATLPGVGEAVKSLSRAFPILMGVVKETGPVVADALKEIADARWVDQLGDSIRPNLPVISDLGTTLKSVLNILADLAIAGAPAMRWMSDAMKRWAGIAEEAVRTGTETGRLQAFFARAVEQAKRLGHIFSNLFKIIYYVATGGSSLGNELLQSWSDVTDRMVEKVRTNQSAIRAYFEGLRPLLAEIGHLFSALSTWIIKLGDDSDESTATLVSRLRLEVLPALEKLVETASKEFGNALIGFLTEAIELFNFFSKSGGQLTSFLNVLKMVLKGLNALLSIDLVRKLGGWYFAILGASQALQLLAKIGVLPMIGLVGKISKLFLGAKTALRLFSEATLLAEASQVSFLGKITSVWKALKVFFATLKSGKTAQEAFAAASVALNTKLAANEAVLAAATAGNTSVGTSAIFATFATEGFAAGLKMLWMQVMKSPLLPWIVGLTAAALALYGIFKVFTADTPEEKLAKAREEGIERLRATIKSGGDVRKAVEDEVKAYEKAYAEQSRVMTGTGTWANRSPEGAMTPEEFKESLLKRPDIATYLELPGVFEENVAAAQFFADRAGKSLQDFRADLQETLDDTGPGARHARVVVFQEMIAQVEDFKNSIAENFTSASEVIAQFSGTSKVNLDKVQQSLDDQIKMYDEYDELLAQVREKAEKGGVDISGLEATLASMGIEGLGILRGAAGASTKDLAKLSGSMKKLDDQVKNIADSFAETMLPVLEEFINAMREIYELEPIDLKARLDAREAEQAARDLARQILESGLQPVTNKMKMLGGPDAIPTFHSGGVVGDPSNWAAGARGGDEVDTRLKRGEFVVNQQATRSNRELLEMINSGRRKYHLGGVVDTLRAVHDGMDGQTFAAKIQKPNFLPPAEAYPGRGGSRNGATPSATAAYDWARQVFPSLSGNLGVGHTWIGATGVRSQHSFGNALDLFGPVADMARLFVTSVLQSGLLHLRTAIFDKMVWQNASDGAKAVAKPYDVPPGGSTHEDHVHLDFWPPGRTPPSSDGVSTAGGGWKLPLTAMGGVVTSRQARIVGESGPEAIIPLPRFFEGLRRGFVPQLPATASPVAQAAVSGAQRVEITLEVDGAVLTKTVEMHGRKARILLGDRRT